MIERRKYPRVSTCVPGEFLLPSSLIPQGSCSVVNMSLDGMLVDTKSEFTEGTNLFLYLHIPVTVSGRIVRREGNGSHTRYAIKLDPLEYIDSLKLKNYIDAQLLH